MAAKKKIAKKAAKKAAKKTAANAAKKKVAKKAVAKKTAVKKAAGKKAVAKKTTARKATARKATAKKAAAKEATAKKATAKKATAKKAAAKKAAGKKATAKKAVSPKGTAKKAAAKKTAKQAPAQKAAKKVAVKEQAKAPAPPEKAKPAKPVVLTNFVKNQRKRLLDLQDELMDAMYGVQQETLRNAPSGSEASGSGMHQGDAGSDAYDRDFALNLLSKEQDALQEIQAALSRIESGTYGICEISGKRIPHPRLEAIPFARLTVECQSQWEQENPHRQFRSGDALVFGATNGSVAVSLDAEGE